PKLTVRVCDSLSCEMAGAAKLLADLPAALGRDVRVVRAPCMGLCDKAPACAVGHDELPHASVDSVKAATAKPHKDHAHHPEVDYDAYVAAGGFALLKDCLGGKRTREDTIAA